MFKNYKDDIDPDPHQGGEYTAQTHIGKNPPAGLLAHLFLSKAEQQPVLKRLGRDDMDNFLSMHTETRMRLPEEQRQFMKELNPALLDQLMDKKMPVLGVFVGDQLVAGCAVLYPADKDIKSYLAGYEFDGKEETTAVVSAVWTHPDHGGKGLSKKVVSAAMELAVIDGKDTFRAKVDKQNAPSLKIFDWFSFDTKVEGEDSRKVYPILAL